MLENILNKVIDIEDYYGNTIFTLNIDENGNIIKMDNCSIADVCDDYIYDTDKTLIRIQKESE